MVTLYRAGPPGAESACARRISTSGVSTVMRRR
jgi:hypothetical protein